MPGRRSVRRKPAAMGLFIALLGAVVLAGCSSSGKQYIKSSSDQTYFRLPDSWKVYDEKDVLDNDEDLSEEQREAILESTWRTAFDASPYPDLTHVFSTNARHPSGLAIVESLSSSGSDQISDQDLRNRFIPVDQFAEAGQYTGLGYEVVNLDGGFHGLRITGRVASAPDSQIYSEGPAFAFEQISVLNQSKDKLYSLIVMCSATCFEKNTNRIKEVVDSWTVREEK